MCTNPLPNVEGYSIDMDRRLQRSGQPAMANRVQGIGRTATEDSSILRDLSRDASHNAYVLLRGATQMRGRRPPRIGAAGRQLRVRSLPPAMGTLGRIQTLLPHGVGLRS